MLNAKTALFTKDVKITLYIQIFSMGNYAIYQALKTPIKISFLRIETFEVDSCFLESICACRNINCGTISS